MEIAVNLRNPAQFFAAAGIAAAVELPSRFDISEYEGEPSLRASFVLPDFDLEALLKNLQDATFREQAEADGTTYSFDRFNRPIVMSLGQKKIELDWWLNEFWIEKSPLKMWAGTSTPLSMLKRLTKMISSDTKDIFNEGMLSPAGNRPSWGFDPRVARNTGVPGRLARVKIYPITELLCAVGLQLCRPVIDKGEITFCAWRDDLPIELAMIVSELDGVRTSALTAQREKRTRGMSCFSSAEFVANLPQFATDRRFATK
jgi:CRISPR-associated protein Csb3